jgi:hypothetical protein
MRSLRFENLTGYSTSQAKYQIKWGDHLTDHPIFLPGKFISVTIISANNSIVDFRTTIAENSSAN